ncbi:MAG: DNA repair protein RadC [Bacteroidota bacterium]|nr:DNA repair protein RadC [Bacteroidota bacterium]
MNEHTYKSSTSIKTWAEDDRPREKLISKGKHALSNSELMALLIGSGSKNESAVELSKRILDSCNNNLFELSKMSLENLKKFKGIGLVKAINIEAALELGRRSQNSAALEKPVITCSKDSYAVIKSRIENLAHEEFWVLFLNRANKLIHHENISSGGISGTVVDVRMVFRRALDLQATGIVLSHNHPSGNIKPSTQDIELTNKIKIAGTYLDITLIDHIIIGERNYYSFADEGIL